MLSLILQSIPGATDYTQGAGALADVGAKIAYIGDAVLLIVYALSAIFAIYNAAVIYIKLNTGEGGFAKAVLMLVGACLFLLTAIQTLPRMFISTGAGYTNIFGP